MADRKAFLLRINPAVLDALQRWANDDLRSLNAQIEYVLRQTLAKAGRGPKRGTAAAAAKGGGEGGGGGSGGGAGGGGGGAGDGGGSG